MKKYRPVAVIMNGNSESILYSSYYFTMKSYSHRRKLNKLRKELEKDEKETKYNNPEN